MNPKFMRALVNDDAMRPLMQNMTASERDDLIARLSAATRRAIGQAAGSGGSDIASHSVPSGPTDQRFRLWNNYYSVIRFQATVSVVGAVTTLPFTQQELRPFSYRIGDPTTSAGFDPTFGPATEAETNLTKAGETIAGNLVMVEGISLMPSSVTDIGLWKLLVANISVAIGMDGDAHKYRLGRPDMLPGSGGTFGSGFTPTLPPDLPSSQFIDGSFSNGWPVIDNFYPFPEPLQWSPSGETDSNFNVILRLQRQQVVIETARAAAAGVAAFTPPTAAGQFGTFVDFMARLHSQQRGPRSVNQ